VEEEKAKAKATMEAPLGITSGSEGVS